MFEAERKLLMAKGVDVITFAKRNDEIRARSVLERIDLGVNAAWSKATYDQLRELINAEKPDIVHCHNTFPLISPSAYVACKDAGVPVIQTLHNYRLICPGAMLMRNGKPCEDCIGTNLLPALRHRCYRGSICATAAVVYMLAKNRAQGTYANDVDRYIALTQFAAHKMKEGGLPASKISIKPNFRFDPGKPSVSAGEHVVYVGRLSPEKGLGTLLEAWKGLRGVRLKIIGDGPARKVLEEDAERNGVEAVFMGFCGAAEINRELRDAAFMIVPSEWYEGFPMTIVEAYSMGVPVVASDIGSLSEIVIDGVTGAKFTTGKADALADRVRWMLSDRGRLISMHKAARDAYEKNYSPEINFKQLMGIYTEAIEQRRQGA